ncbi:DUF4843 domain-containing protein [Sphingobacterium bovistauri]|uniref:DUF4843 domain-containing protein n=1 Tax=Sphingobacterium bovistauri TaxID=2781959 RepID=A0ABS7Z811_9SPHI|nr:DUF4843 domain-containing protein [Sphingobacterium bovistauri]MCA5005546.1 DUF4843 domain-containing protein [Sphingobacterium bovistauri]
MKNKFLIYLSFLLCLLLSCEKDNMQYSGPEGIYFGVRDFGLIVDTAGPFQPSSRVDFLVMNTSQYTYRMPILLAGPVKDYDRQFKITVELDSTTLEQGKHYAVLKDIYTLPAGAHRTWVNIDFFAAPDLDLAEKRLVIKIVETNDLKPAFNMWDPPTDINGSRPAQKMDASRHTIIASNMMVTPTAWLGKAQPNGEEFNALGVFTRRKMEFITEHLGLAYFEFLDAERMSLLRMSLIGQQLSRLLIQRFDAGNPVLEEDGRLMYAEGVPWKSYVGVPYKP